MTTAPKKKKVMLSIPCDPDVVAWLRENSKQFRVPQGELVRRLLVDHKAMMQRLVVRAMTRAKAGKR